MPSDVCGLEGACGSVCRKDGLEFVFRNGKPSWADNKSRVPRQLGDVLGVETLDQRRRCGGGRNDTEGGVGMACR